MVVKSRDRRDGATGRHDVACAGGRGLGFAFAAVLVVNFVDFFRAYGAEPPSGDEGDVVQLIAQVAAPEEAAWGGG